MAAGMSNWWYADTTTSTGAGYTTTASTPAGTYIVRDPYEGLQLIPSPPEYDLNKVISLKLFNKNVSGRYCSISFSIGHILNIINEAYDQGRFIGFFNDAPVEAIKQLFYISCYMYHKEQSVSSALYIKTIASLLYEWGYDIWA